jgi:hypothetical protein
MRVVKKSVSPTESQTRPSRNTLETAGPERRPSRKNALQGPIALDSKRGIQLFHDLDAKDLTTLVRLMQHSQSRREGMPDGLWAVTTGVNALHLPDQPTHEDYIARGTDGTVMGSFAYQVQDDFRKLLPPDAGSSPSLSSLVTAIKKRGLEVARTDVRQATEAQVTSFRDQVCANLSDPNHHLLVTFGHPDGREQQGLVAAYNPLQDQCLVLTMDGRRGGVEQPRYEWMSPALLVNKMAAPSSPASASGSNEARGFATFGVESAGNPPTGSGPDCVALTSAEGQERLARASFGMLSKLARLMPYFEPQPNVSFCNIRTFSMFANDLKLPLARTILRKERSNGMEVPVVRESDVLDAVRRMHPTTVGGHRIDADAIVFPRGAFMDEVDAIARMFGAKTELHHVNDTDPEYQHFKLQALRALRDPDQHIMVQFDRRGVGQAGAGHYSALAAYDAVSDSFLLYDTATFKLDCSWIPARELFSAMSTVDADAEKAGMDGRRGYLLVAKP